MREVVLLVALYALTGIGITVGFHRLLTHRAFTAHPAVRVALLGLGSMAAQGRCIDWAAHHLKHHAHADRPGDPHSPMDGFLHAHIGWVFAARRPSASATAATCSRIALVARSTRRPRSGSSLGLIVP